MPSVGHDNVMPDMQPWPLTGKLAICRIRTDDPEITSHVLWPAELSWQLIQLYLCPAEHGHYRDTPVIGIGERRI